MKTLGKSLFVAFALTLVSFSVSHATNRPITGLKAVAYETSLYTDAKGNLRIAIDKQTGGTVEVRLVNSEGKEFFVERIGKQQQKARMKLDVSELPDGNYQVAVSNGAASLINNLTISTQQPSFTGRMIAVK
ncbi:T9SS type A sorting domain-containing protein [Larkinella terrae]|uniref:Secretion system C-terminal sorting domain-containing protein n=1 Tax=Larkinella terrae TaxID=2025311 RepID=A0A7K0ESD8_9BACT|nr:T9SS type A sorting domain-containing protein [Larkinella terrae]MRS64720.1 hypothetical protein [Larkinella terrae]